MHKSVGKAKARFVGKAGADIDSIVMDCEVVEHVSADSFVIDGLFNDNSRKEVVLRVVACSDPTMWNINGKLNRASSISNRANGGEYRLHTVWPAEEQNIKVLLDAGFAIQKI